MDETGSISTWLDPEHLQNHPLNAEIYRDVADEELVASVRQHGVIQPIILATDGRTIISGHRRRQAALISKTKLVPVRIQPDLTEDLDIREAALECNRNRVKTPEQKARELEEWKHIAAKRAEIQALPPHKDELSARRALNSPQRGAGKKRAGRPAAGGGNTEAAKAMGVSTRHAEQLTLIGKALDEADEAGDTETAAAIRGEKSVAGAYQAAKKPGDKNKKSPADPDDPAVMLRAMAKVIEKERAKIDQVTAKVGHHEYAEKALDELDAGIIALRKWANALEKET